MTQLPHWLPRMRRALVLACVLLGFAGGALTGVAGQVLCGLGAAGVLWGRLRGRRHGPVQLQGWRVANAVALAGCVLAVVAGVPVLPVALGLVCWLQVHRASSGAPAAEDAVALLMTLLMVLLTCILTTSSLLGPLFVLLALLGPLALLLAWLEAELGAVAGVGRERSASLGGLWGLPVFAVALTSFFFVALPRVHTSPGIEADGLASMSGFNDDVELGDFGEILDNPQVVMRVEVRDGTGAPVPGPFVFRGVSLDHFDGRRWQSSLGGRVTPGRSSAAPGPAERVLIQDITLEPIADGVLFALAPVWSVRDAGPAVSVDTSGTWRTEDAGRTLRYTATSLLRVPGEAVAFGPVDPSRVARRRNQRAALRAEMWTDLPPGLDPRVTELARELARQAGEDASPYDRSRHAADWLRGNFSYTTVPDPRTARQPLESFLFETRSGHCEFFATGLAVLLRAQGTPTRVVNGFMGGEYNELGDFWVIRQRDAHSWVEAWLDDGSGQMRWVALDATPESDERPSVGSLRQVSDWLAHAWDRGVIRYDLDKQVEIGLRGLALAQRVRGPVSASAVPELPQWLPGLVGGGALLGLALFGARTVRFLEGRGVRRRPAGAVARCWGSARRLVARRGWALPEALPPVEAARWLRERAGDEAAPLETLAWLHYRVRYGGASDADLGPDARAALQALRRLPTRR